MQIVNSLIYVWIPSYKDKDPNQQYAAQIIITVNHYETI